MNVLGISAHFHDATAALMVDDAIVASVAEERISRQKHDASLPLNAASACLAFGGLSAQDLDAVVFYEAPHEKFTRVLASTMAGFPRTLGRFVSGMKGWLGEKLFVRNALSKALDVHPNRVAFSSHHASHATHAFVMSGFDEAAVLVVDAVGEWTTTSIGRARRGEPVELLETHEYPDSLGLFYAAFTGFLGFAPNSEECSTMALASFGQPTRVAEVRQVLRLAEDGTFSLARDAFDLLADGKATYTPSFVRRFGEPANAATVERYGTLDALAPAVTVISPELTPWVDLAASVQSVLEEALLGLCRRAARLVPTRRLCLAGGVALNCVAVSRLAREGPFETMFVPPDPGDGGAAVGAALAHALREGRTVTIPKSPFLGLTPRYEDVHAMLEHLDPAHLSRVNNAGSVTCHRFTDDDRGLGFAADRLAMGKIVAWVDSRAETGPRALGHRSLLAHPGRLDTVRRLGRAVKRRAAFRPYALSLNATRATGVLHEGRAAGTLPWMQRTAPVHDGLRPQLRGGVHVDGTTRPQIVSREAQPRFAALLDAFEATTGVPALLNTSLNERGQPLVDSAVDALTMFARTDLDVLMLDTLALERTR